MRFPVRSGPSHSKGTGAAAVVNNVVLNDDTDDDDRRLPAAPVRFHTWYHQCQPRAPRRRRYAR